MDDAARASLEGFRKLQKEYATAFPAKIEEIRSLVSELRLSLNEETLTTLKFNAHKIAGNAGAYGFPLTSTVGAEFEHYLSSILDAFKNGKIDEHSIDECDSYVQKLEQAFLTDTSDANNH